MFWVVLCYVMYCVDMYQNWYRYSQHVIASLVYYCPNAPARVPVPVLPLSPYHMRFCARFGSFTAHQKGAHKEDEECATCKMSHI